MPAIGRLPSGKWQAQVRLPDGRRITRSDPLRRVVAEWARQVEAEVARGRWHDPRTARRLTLTEWRKQWIATRIVSPATIAKNASHWANHVEARFGRLPLDAIDRPALRTWIADLHRQNVGAHTIEAAVRHLAKMLTDAVDADLLPANPAARLKLPPTALRAPFFWTRDEAAEILDARVRRGRRTVPALTPPMRMLVDFDMHTGLRIGEITGMWCEQVDCSAAIVHVTAAQTRYGREPYTKGRKLRTVPVPPHLASDLSALVSGKPGDALVFPAPHGGPLDDTDFRARIFLPALRAAGVRLGSPHDMRHTAASWLVMDGVDLYRVQALLGHESFRTTQRYAHLAPTAFDAITSAWSKARIEAAQ